jgi:ribulose-5-phosphate 4-epimerase/fuculose-1-phosphate aldolase
LEDRHAGPGPSCSVADSTDVKNRVTSEEWAARVELAALYRVIARYGMTDLIYNHVTLKVPGTADQFLINPYGLAYDEITASSLITINAAGETILQPDPRYGINYTGYVIHGAIHAARPDIHCIAHTHTQAGVAVSSLAQGLLPLNQTALRFHDNLGYHPFEGFALDLSEQARLVASLGERDNLILRNHGLVACGRSVSQTFINLYGLEMSCRIQIAAMSASSDLHPVAPEAITATGDIYGRMRKTGDEGALEWAAQLRWLERNAHDYQT